MKVKDITCLSDLYYVIGRWFTLIAVAVALCVMPVALEVLDSVVSFMMCAGIAFVGVAADYRDRTVYPVHYVAATVSGACSVMWVWNVEPWGLCSIIPFAILAFTDSHRWLLWCEIACLAAVIVAMTADCVAFYNIT